MLKSDLVRSEPGSFAEATGANSEGDTEVEEDDHQPTQEASVP